MTHSRPHDPGTGVQAGRTQQAASERTTGSSHPTGELPAGRLPMEPLPAVRPQPVVWRLSRWRDAHLVLPALGTAGVGNIQRADYDPFLGWMLLATSVLLFLVVTWTVLFPGVLRLDEHGLTHGRRRWAWDQVAPFRLDRSGSRPTAKSYRVLPGTGGQPAPYGWSSPPEEVSLPASVSGISAWRVVGRLNLHRDWALSQLG